VEEGVEEEEGREEDLYASIVSTDSFMIATDVMSSPFLSTASPAPSLSSLRAFSAEESAGEGGKGGRKGGVSLSPSSPEPDEEEVAFQDVGVKEEEEGRREEGGEEGGRKGRKGRMTLVIDVGDAEGEEEGGEGREGGGEGSKSSTPTAFLTRVRTNTDWIMKGVREREREREELGLDYVRNEWGSELTTYSERGVRF